MIAAKLMRRQSGAQKSGAQEIMRVMSPT